MEVLRSAHPGRTTDLGYISGIQNHFVSKPPSPPIETSSKMSLPPISSLLGFARDDEDVRSTFSHTSLPYQPNQRTERVSNYDRSYATRNQSGNFANVGQLQQQLPPTPPPQHERLASQPQSPTSSQPRHLPSLGPSLPYDPIINPNSSRHEHHSRYVSDWITPNQGSYSALNASFSPPGALSSQAIGSSSVGPASSSTLRRTTLPSPQHTLHSQQPLPTDFPPPLQIHPPDYSAPAPSSHNPSPVAFHHSRADAREAHTSRRLEGHSTEGSRTMSHHSSAPGHDPQGHDRYICPTCGKAFSRPSSLRIHGHSHTGEKPFKCPHKNCGKAFSVRSNMKRHEKGCHAERERRVDIPSGRISRELLPASTS